MWAKGIRLRAPVGRRGEEAREILERVLRASRRDRRWHLEQDGEGPGWTATTEAGSLTLLVSVAPDDGSDDEGWVVSVLFYPGQPPRWRSAALSALLLAVCASAALSVFAATESALGAVAVFFGTVLLSMVAIYRLVQRRRQSTAEPRSVRRLAREIEGALERSEDWLEVRGEPRGAG